MTQKHKEKVLGEINSYIFKALEDGVCPWRNPFEPHQGSSGHVYRGINRLILTMIARSKGYTSHKWFTFNGQRKAGGRIIGGEKGTRIVYYGMAQSKEKNEDGTPKFYPTFKSWHVFNADQIEWETHPDEQEDETEMCDALTLVEKYLEREKINRTYHATQAYYSVTKDYINVPQITNFTYYGAYIPTLFHEIGHSTGAKRRLNRAGIAGVEEAQHRDHCTYSMEELVAEMTAAYLCGHTGVGMDHLDQSASYIKGWLERLKDNPQMLHDAMHEAEKAFQFITGDITYENAE